MIYHAHSLNLWILGFPFLSFFIIFSSYPLYALLWWILLISSSSIFILSLGLGFLAFSYFILYIGAIIILFLFVIMTLHNFRPDHVASYGSMSYLLPILLLLFAFGSPHVADTPFSYFSFHYSPFLKDILPSLAYPLFTFYSFLWYPSSLLLFLSLLFPIYLLVL